MTLRDDIIHILHMNQYHLPHDTYCLESKDTKDKTHGREADEILRVVRNSIVGQLQTLQKTDPEWPRFGPGITDSSLFDRGRVASRTAHQMALYEVEDLIEAMIRIR